MIMGKEELSACGFAIQLRKEITFSSPARIIASLVIDHINIIKDTEVLSYCTNRGYN